MRLTGINDRSDFTLEVLKKSNQIKSNQISSDGQSSVQIIHEIAEIAETGVKLFILDLRCVLVGTRHQRSWDPIAKTHLKFKVCALLK